VFDFIMTSRTVHFSFGDMGVVHERYIIVPCQPLRFIVTVVTFLLMSASLSLDDIEVTFFTVDMTNTRKILMVERDPMELNILLRIFMAGSAVSKRKHPLLFRLVPEVAKEASAVCHLNMRTHNNLGVTARTAQLFAPP
jgi:hypothetical protein